VVVAANFAGKQCPAEASAYEKTCNVKDCNVDCKMSEWSKCSKPCGVGVKRRITLQHPVGDVAACGLNAQSCNTHGCPVDCQASEWGQCSANCGGGTQSRTIQRELFGGKTCESYDIEQACNNNVCPIDCEVSEWSVCVLDSVDVVSNVPCGTGTQSRTIKVHPNSVGVQCPKDQDKDEITRSCGNTPCQTTTTTTQSPFVRPHLIRTKPKMTEAQKTAAKQSILEKLNKAKAERTAKKKRKGKN
jgi:hypothetical protein